MMLPCTHILVAVDKMVYSHSPPNEHFGLYWPIGFPEDDKKNFYKFDASVNYEMQ